MRLGDTKILQLLGRIFHSIAVYNDDLTSFSIVLLSYQDCMSNFLADPASYTKGCNILQEAVSNIMGILLSRWYLHKRLQHPPRSCQQHYGYYILLSRWYLHKRLQHSTRSCQQYYGHYILLSR